MNELPRANMLLRQWRLLVKLRRGWWTLEEMAEELGVTTRTIRRDLAVLETVPFPIVQTEPGDVPAGLVKGRRSVSEFKDKRMWSVAQMDTWPRNEAMPVREVA